MKFNKEKTKEFFKEKGIYLVLMACVAAVGLAAAAVFVPQLQSEPAPTDALFPASVDEGERLDAAKTPEPTPEPTPTPLPDMTPAATVKPPPAQKKKISPPVQGEVIWGFAMDELIFSRTLNQWMTHGGVDIKSPLGSEVYAVLAGTVESVTVDDRLGVTIVIRHTNDVKTVYANLKEEPPVKKNSKVNAGALIGYIGNTAISECDDESHLHFEYHVKDKPVDPGEYVLFQKSVE